MCIAIVLNIILNAFQLRKSRVTVLDFGTYLSMWLYLSDVLGDTA